uniref:Peptide transporter family 1 n=1 Tax=Parascaris univalens TaxID=6257 RepID=A0A914ZXW5_PARUN
MQIAIRNAIRSKVTREHWLEHYFDTHHCEKDKDCVVFTRERPTKNICGQKAFVKNVEALLRVTVMLLPVPMFWALYDQQGSKWVVQAVSMNSQITSSFSLLPDQMSTFNSILIMAFIPVFQLIIYPTVQKLGIHITPLRKMVVGGIFGSLAFVSCAIVQFRINQTLPNIPSTSTAFVSFVNLYDNCTLTLRSSNFPSRTIAFNKSLLDDKVSDVHEIYRIDVDNVENRNRTFEAIPMQSCGHSRAHFTIMLQGGRYYYGILSPYGFVYNEANLAKPTSGQEQSSVNINLLLPCSVLPETVEWGSCRNRLTTQVYSDGIALCRYKKNSPALCEPYEPSSFYAWSTKDAKSVANATFYTFKDVKIGTYGVYYIHYMNTTSGHHSSRRQITAVPMQGIVVNINGIGAVYSLTIQPANDAGTQYEKLMWNMHTVVPANDVSILWQVPQYIIITAAEILISITGLEFAYSQAAPALKSVVQAVWLLTVAFGDIIIIIIEVLDLFHNLATEMLIYAIVMLIVTFLFALLAIFYYEYVDFSKEQEHVLMESEAS